MLNGDVYCRTFCQLSILGGISKLCGIIMQSHCSFLSKIGHSSSNKDGASLFSDTCCVSAEKNSL